MRSDGWTAGLAGRLREFHEQPGPSAVNRSRGRGAMPLGAGVPSGQRFGSFMGTCGSPAREPPEGLVPVDHVPQGGEREPARGCPTAAAAPLKQLFTPQSCRSPGGASAFRGQGVTGGMLTPARRRLRGGRGRCEAGAVRLVVASPRLPVAIWPNWAAVHGGRGSGGAEGRGGARDGSRCAEQGQGGFHECAVLVSRGGRQSAQRRVLQGAGRAVVPVGGPGGGRPGFRVSETSRPAAPQVGRQVRKRCSRSRAAPVSRAVPAAGGCDWGHSRGGWGGDEFGAGGWSSFRTDCGTRVRRGSECES